MIKIKQFILWFIDNYNFLPKKIYLVEKRYIYQWFNLYKNIAGLYYWLRNNPTKNWLIHYNLNDSLELNLCKITSFFDTLYNIKWWAYAENDDFDIEYSSELKLRWIVWNKEFSFLSSGNATDYWEIKILENWLIEITWLWDYTNNYPPAIPFKDWKTTFTRKEFYFVMQLHYWIYQEEELFKQLKSNEKAWKYDEVKNILNNYTIDWWEFYNWWKLVLDELKNWLKYDENLLEEYLKLELMRKDISWAFDWIKIEKVFDKDWDEEKQLEVVDKINKDFWEEVLIYE